MSNAAEIIDALHKCGATVVIEDGKARVRGAKISDELMEAVRANKAEILAEWERRQAGTLDRYGEVPTEDVPQFGRNVNLSHAQKLVVVGHAFRQPRPVHAWVMARTSEYHTLGLTPGDDEAAACVDLLCWQRNNSSKSALEWLAGIDACWKNLQTQ